MLTWKEIALILSLVRTPVLLYGKPALGKTRIAVTPDCYSLTLTQDSPAAEARGHYVPKGDHFDWQHGPAIRAWLEGKRLVLNEIDLASGDMLTFCLALLDDPAIARLTLPNSETVRPVMGFSAVGTMNGKPEDLPEPLRSRFAIQIEVKDLNPEALDALNPRYRATATASVTGESNLQADVRKWYAFAALAQQVPEELAAKAVFSHAYQEVLTAVALSNVKVRSK